MKKHYFILGLVFLLCCLFFSLGFEISYSDSGWDSSYDYGGDYGGSYDYDYGGGYDYDYVVVVRIVLMILGLEFSFLYFLSYYLL